MDVGVYLEPPVDYLGKSCRFFIAPLTRKAYDGRKFIEAVKLETEKWLDGKNGQPAWLELRDVNSRARWKKW
jgi:hypothetical protein